MTTQKQSRAPRMVLVARRANEPTPDSAATASPPNLASHPTSAAGGSVASGSAVDPRVVARRVYELWRRELAASRDRVGGPGA